MGITPIERFKAWLAGLGEYQARPEGWLKCADCGAQVAPSGGEWDGYDRVVNCSDICAANWVTDRSH
jgi:hypothetical protein